jgi:hypothetical protein
VVAIHHADLPGRIAHANEREIVRIQRESGSLRVRSRLLKTQCIKVRARVSRRVPLPRLRGVRPESPGKVRMKLLRIACLALAFTGAVVSVACSEGDSDIFPASPISDAGLFPLEAGADAGLFPPPNTPVEPSPLTDQSRSLQSILEEGTLTQTDCDNYFAGQTDRTTTLRCGKWMFFYDNIDVPGSPSQLVDLIRENAPDTVGESFQHLGLFPDPYSSTRLPVGMAPGPTMTGGVTTYTLTCGSCHFGQTPDGRYVVGSPNHQFSFGQYALAVASLPTLAAEPGTTLAPEVEQALGPIRDEVFGNPLTQLSIIGQAIQLLPALIVTQATPPDAAAMLALAVNPTGVMDPYAPPSLDDGVPNSVRMSPLWGIDPTAMTAAGSTHGAMLGSSGGAPDLEHILRTFAYIAGTIRKLPLGPDYDPSKVMPLIQYIMSLVPPPQETPPDPTLAAEGEVLFRQNCFQCHDGPAFAGTVVQDPNVIGTDPNIINLLDPNDTGMALDDVVTPPELTRGVRSRRLSAVWSLGRLFHNGSASSLSDVFCLDGPRAASPPYAGRSTVGHTYTCDALSTDQKEALIAFLQTL